MITKEEILNNAQDFLASINAFIVKIDIKKNNVINIELDSEPGVTIDQCIKLNRFLQDLYLEKLDAYELNVLSPGADAPVLDIKQMPRALGKEFIVTIEQEEEQKDIKGILESVDIEKEEFNITSTTREQIPGKKSKQTVIRTSTFVLKNIKKVNRTISFK